MKKQFQVTHWTTHKPLNMCRRFEETFNERRYVDCKQQAYKICPTPLVIRKMPFKTTVKYYYTPSRMTP